MPTISQFYGIIIQMFWNEHATYAEYKATVDIKNLRIMEGSLPRRATQLVLDWAELHQTELLEDWNLCLSNHQPNTIPPLK